MDCPNCKTFYNENSHIPRLLIQCGHSLCEKCTYSLFSNNSLLCPECNTPNYVGSIEAFPQNLSLLLINKSRQNLDQINGSMKERLFFCPKHNKKIEAFCSKEKKLICINCILEDGHRSHEIISLQNAASKERDLIHQAYETCNIIQEKIRINLSEINHALISIREDSDKSKLDLAQFYVEIRKILDERENYLKMKIVEHFLKQEEMLKNKEKNLFDHLNQIKVFNDEYEKSMSYDDISLLENCCKMQETILKATCQVEKLLSLTNFQDLNRESEIAYLQKYFYKKMVGNIVNNNCQQKIKNTQKSLNQNHLLTLNKRKSTPSNGIHINSNNKELKKKNQKNSIRSENSPLKKNSNVCEKRIKSRNKNYENNNLEDDKISNKIFKKNSSDLFNETSTVPIYFNNMNKSPLKTINNQTISQPLKSLLNYREIRDAYKEHFHYNENEIINKSSTSITPKKSQNKTGIKRIEFLDSDSNNHKNYFGKKSYNKSPNLTYLSLDTSQNYENSNIESKKKYILNEIENNYKDNLNQSHSNETKGEEEGKNDKKEGLMFFDRTISEIETKNSVIEGEYDKFLQSTENKGNERLDLSSIYHQFHHFIYVLGGFFDNPANAIERFDLQKNLWEEIGYFPSNRAKFGAISLSNGNFLVIGGKQDGVRVSSIDEYIVKEKKWKSYDMKLTESKSGFGILTKNEEFFLIGGNDGSAILNTFEKYQLNEKKVKKLKPMNFARDELAVAFGTDQKIYAIGGFGGPKNCCLNVVERYDPEKDEWEVISSLNTARRALSAVTLPDGIYVIGGFDGFNYLSSVEKFDENKNEWVLIASMNSPRCTLSAIASPDFQYIYVMGGFNNVPLNSVEKYSVLNDSWVYSIPMKFKRFMHTSILSINY